MVFGKVQSSFCSKRSRKGMDYNFSLGIIYKIVVQKQFTFVERLQITNVQLLRLKLNKFK